MKMSDEELISAYLDNELNDIDRADFEKRLQEEDAFAERFATFNENDIALKQHYTAIDDTPVPDSIMSLLEGSEHQEAPLRDNVTEIKHWQRAKWLPIAASFLLVALSIPLYLSMTNDNYPSIASVLGEQASGQSFNLNEEQQIRLTMSFTNGQGNLCREYLLSQQNSAIQSVSCNIDGDWQTQISGEIELADIQSYQPATGKLAENVESWLDANMASDPLSIAEEKQRLRQH